MHNSPTIRHELAKVAGETDLNAKVLVRAVKTRWNTVTMVLDRALEMKDILSGLCDKHEFNQPRGARLRRFILSDDEWTLLEELHFLLEVSCSCCARTSSDAGLAAIPIRHQRDLDQHLCPRPRSDSLYRRAHKACG